jgi:regulator of sirC expression with transglutaminase-like and TPR domain
VAYPFRQYVQAVLNARGVEAAIAACDTKLAAMPTFAAAFLERGMARERLGRRDEALADYLRAQHAARPGTPLWNEARQRRQALHGTP